MLKWIKRIIITGIIVIGTLANQGTIGVTTTVAQAEDNSAKNGWYYYCDNNSIIDMNDTYLNKTFVYFQDKETKQMYNILGLN
ncbi:TPA: hypothetical protein N2D16_002888 [Clostridium botulinum]|nr:hypothetical protein [Clostridium botulinum]HCL4455268.1 hypothetical protein [Clostridium botulinum]